MAGITKTTDTTIAYEYQVYFSRQLLDRMLPSLTYAEFALKTPLPKSQGAKSIRMMRFAAPDTGSVISLTEGTIPTYATHKQLTLEFVECPLLQYGQSISITDVLDATSLFNMTEQANTTNAEDAALHCDKLTMYELTKTSGAIGTGSPVDYSTRNVIYGGNKTDYAGVWNTNGAFDANAVLTALDILDGATALKVNKAPKIAGSYVMVAPPQVARDIMAGAATNTIWADVSKYSAREQIFNGELGKLYGVKFIETSESYRSAGTQPTTNPSAQYSPTGAVFTAHMFGRNAYGISDITTLGSPMGPQVYVVDGPDKSDPLNQIKAIVSWKTFWAALVLQPKWLVQIYTQTASGL